MSQKTAKTKRRAARNRTQQVPAVLKEIPAPKNGAPLEQKVSTTQKIWFKVPGELAQQILDYIQTKPFQEVHQLVGGMMRCEKIKE